MATLTSTQGPATEVTPPSPVACSDAELVARIEGLEREMRVLMMEQLQFIAEADHRGVHTDRSSRTTQTFLQGLLNIDARDAKARVRVARNVQERQALSGEPMPAEAPATAEALAAGAIGLDHASAVVEGVRRLPDHVRWSRAGEVESTLAAYAREMTPREVEKLAERIKYLADQDGAYADEEAQHEARELHYTTTRGGMTVIKARLDREAGAKFAALMEPLAAPRPELDGEKDSRTTGQRNADGFAALLDLALDHDGLPRSGGQRPHMTVTVDFEDLKQGLGETLADKPGMPGTLNTERAITIENARRLACDAEVLPMLLGGDGVPLDIGRARRTAPTHLRAALLRRDDKCCFPECDRPPGTPEAHHIVSWIDGGPTDLDNMVMLCGHHHRAVHNQRWRIEMHDQRPVFTPPFTVDPQRRPRPGRRAIPDHHDQYLRDLAPTPRAPAGAPTRPYELAG